MIKKPKIGEIYKYNGFQQECLILVLKNKDRRNLFTGKKEYFVQVFVINSNFVDKLPGKIENFDLHMFNKYSTLQVDKT